MSLIKINIGKAVAVSESAAKPQYKIAKVGGVQTLVVSSAKKAELQSVVGLLKKAKTAAVAGITASIKSNTAATKARQLTKSPRKTALMETRKSEKAKSSASLKEAKKLIKEANTYAKKHGLGGLNLPLSAADIKTGVGATAAMKKIRATKLTEFGLTGKRGVFKPKFVKEAAFDALGSKTVTKAAKKAPAPVKPIRKMKGAITGAHTPAKARALKKQRAEALTGKKPEGISGSAPGKRIDDYTDPKVKSAITRFVKKPDSDLSRLTKEELRFAQSSLLNKRQSRANMGYGKKAGTLYNADTYQRVMDEIERRKG